MACGDPGAAFKVALLDLVLPCASRASVTSASGYDALSHAVESFVTTVRTPLSQTFRAEAWRLTRGNLGRVLREPDDLDARGAMLLGSHLAGLAIEHSMLGAGHACANPLTAQFDVAHGIAVSLMLPHVVRWNAEVAGPLYPDLLQGTGRPIPRRRTAGRRAGAGRGDLRLPAEPRGGRRPRGRAPRARGGGRDAVDGRLQPAAGDPRVRPGADQAAWRR